MSPTYKQVPLEAVCTCVGKSGLGHVITVRYMLNSSPFGYRHKQ